MIDKREAAVALAKKGFRVFPCAINGKIPAVKDDFSARASSDPAKVREWWTEAVTGESSHHNIGISTDDLLVMDFDVKGGLPGIADSEEFDALFKFQHMVETPSGGYHAYFRLPKGIKKVAGSIKKIRKSLDVKSWHGYVLGPGSEIDGKTYSWVESADNTVPASRDELAEAPPLLIEKCGAPRERETRSEEGTEWDSPSAIAAAKSHLAQAEGALIGARGSTAYKVAARVRDFAVSEAQCLELLLEHWNVEGRVDPVMPLTDLAESVDHAYRYAKNAPRSPGSEFEAVDIAAEAIEPPNYKIEDLFDDEPAKSKASNWPRFIDWEAPDFSEIPKRDFIIEKVCARGYVTLVSSDPGAGKTQWLAQLALGVACNSEALAGFRIVKPVNVWSINAEDEMDELNRRIGAAMIAYDVTQHAPRKRISLNSGVDRELSIAKWDAPNQRIIKNTKAIEQMIQDIIANDVGLLIVDPLAEIHTAPEQSNDVMKIVTGLFRQVAVRANCAVIVATHTRKPAGASSEGTAGNQNTVRGASSQTGVARFVITLVPASIKDNKILKVPEEERGYYVRIDLAKGNMNEPGRGTRPDWFKFKSTPLGNGDMVGVLHKVDVVESRVTKEAHSSAIEAADRNAVAIADAMEDDGCLDSQKYNLSKFKTRVGKMLDIKTDRKSGFAKYPSRHYGKMLPAGEGRSIEFVKPVGGGSATKVILRRQAISQLVSADSSADSSADIAGAEAADLDTSNFRTNEPTQVEWAQ